MSEHDRLEELAHLYPLGGLDPEDRARVDQHLATGCETCEHTLLEGLRVAGQLLEAVDPIPPAPAVKAQLLARARAHGAGETRAPQVEASRPTWLAAAAALLLAVGLGVYALSLRSQSDALRTSLREEQASRQSAEARIDDAEARVDDLESRLATLTAPGARAVSLSGQGDAAGARARAFLDPESRQLLLYVYDLPALPAGQTYQLWVIVGGSPISAGTFDVAEDGRARYEAEPVPPLEPGTTVALAVTIEPAGGVPQPTGAMALVES